MQNSVNLKTPFLDSDGFPLHAGRVRFVMDDTSGELIHIYDKDGTLIQNPLPLNELGVFQIQPFVEDGLSYRMLVEKDTGIPQIPPETGNVWQVVDEIVFKAQGVEIGVDGIPSVDGILELRALDPSAGSVVVKGYVDSDDQCPPRIFVWKSTVREDNGGTRIRSQVEGYESSGTWFLETNGEVDLRWFGYEAGDGRDVASVISLIDSQHYGERIYFAPGTWAISTSVSVKSARLDMATIKPYSETGEVKSFVCEDLKVSSGGFSAYDAEDASSARIVPVTRGTLRSSWLVGTVNEFLTSSALADIDRIVFDSIRSAGVESVTIENKFVEICDGVTLSGISFSDCVVMRLEDGKIEAVSFYASESPYNVELDANHIEFSYYGGTATLDATSLTFETDSDTVEYGSGGVFIRNSVFQSKLIDRELLLSKENGDKQASVKADIIKILNESGYEVSMLANGIVVSHTQGGTTTSTQISPSSIRTPFIQSREFIEHTYTDILAGGSVDNTKFASYENILVVPSIIAATTNFTIDITATPTAGRAVKVFAKFDGNEGVTYPEHVGIMVKVNGTNKVFVSPASSVWLVADGTDWNIDYTRI